MGIIDSPDKLWYTLAGALLVWLGRILANRIQQSTEQRRQQVDAHAAALTENRKLKESLHAHRVEMLKTGAWTQDTLPPFMKE